MTNIKKYCREYKYDVFFLLGKYPTRIATDMSAKYVSYVS